MIKTSSLLFLALCSLSAASCSSPPGTKDSAPIDDSAEETGLEECELSDSDFTDINARLGAVQTVVVLNWSTTLAGEQSLRFTDSNGTLQTVPAGVGTNARALMLGLESNRDHEVQLLLHTEDGRSLCSIPRTVTSGGLPMGLPGTETTILDPEKSVGGFLVTTIIAEKTAFPVILNSKGKCVWAAQRRIEEGIVNTRTTLSLDRSEILLAETLWSPPFGGHIRAMSLDGEELWSLDWPLGIDFLRLPDGLLAVLTRFEQTFTLSSGEEQTWIGDRIVEIDPESGESEIIWDVFDELSPEDPLLWREPGKERDWAHVNSLSYDELDDSYLVTAENPEGAIKIQRSTGDIEWMLHAADFPAQPTSLSPVKGLSMESLLARPHSARLLDGSVLLFNRSETWDTTSCAFTSELSIDEDAREVDLAWSWSSDQCRFVDYLGEAERMPGGNTQVIWSAAGMIDEVTPEGESVFNVYVDHPSGMAFLTFGERTDSLYEGATWSGRQGERP